MRVEVRPRLECGLRAGLDVKAFGSFRLDRVNHCLWRDDKRVPLTPKAFDVLRYLVEHADRLVTQDELLEALWPETYVNPEGIRKYILEIRKVLGDQSGQPAFIKTFPKRGYQFVAAVSAERRAAQTAPAHELSRNMVGRQEGLARLDGYLKLALSGQRQVVFVTGEAGVGKTTLVDVFQQQAARHSGLQVARGQCIEGFGGIEAYYPMLEAIGSLLRFPGGSTFLQTIATRAPTWLVQFPRLVKPEQREALQREILGSTRERMVREFCEALEDIGAHTPLFVILEDLHWVDVSTLNLISAFARRRDPAKVLFLGTYRPVDVVLSDGPLKALKQDLFIRRLCHEIALECFEECDVADYLAKNLSVESLPAGLANLIHRNSGGNPLFMAAIVRDMESKRLIAVEQGRLILTAPLEEVYPGIPETLQQMLEIQLEHLDPEDQRILQSASVAGERFPVCAVMAMLDVSRASVENACDRLANREQFIRSVGIHSAADGAPSAHYEFRHSLYRQALYRSLSSLQRSQLHRSLGERLMLICNSGKPEMAAALALHFEEGRDYEGAVRCLIVAAENAASRFSHRDSIHVLRRALELVRPLEFGSRLELETQILQRIGDTQFVLGEMADSAESYEIAAKRAAQTGLNAVEAEALIRMALPAWYLDAARGNEVCQRALEVCASLDDPLMTAQARLTLSSLRLLFDEWGEEEAEVCVNAIQSIRRSSGSSVIHHGLHIHVPAFQGNYQDAHREADALIATTANSLDYARACSAKSIALLFQGRFGELLQLIRTGRVSAEKNGEYPWMYMFSEAWLRLLCFDFDGAHRLGEIVMRTDVWKHAARLKAISGMSRGYAALSQKDHGEALQYFSQVLDPDKTPRFFAHWYFRLHARLGVIEARLLAGDPAVAHRDIDDFVAGALRGAEPNVRALAWEMKSRVARAEKDFDAARTCIDNALAIVHRFDIPAAAWRVHSSALDLYGDRADRERTFEHRSRAKELIMRIADSFEHDEPLRVTLLTAPPVRRIFEQGASA
jgi:DNA-binding winged helix-turn-helix (wHTH) protein/tetratricopeptide (TPR) repeat protein